MTEAEVRTTLAAFDAIGGMERWIAAQPWLAAPGGWVVPEPFHGLRFRVEPVARGVRVRAFADKAEPAAWIVPAKCGTVTAWTPGAWPPAPRTTALVTAVPRPVVTP